MIQGNELDNSKILTEMLAEEFRQAREKLIPSAESIIDNLGDLRIK